MKSFSITWGFLARMDGIVSAEHFNVLYKMPQFYSVSKSYTGSYNTEGAWLNTWHMYHGLHFIRCPKVSQFMSPVQSSDFTPTHALLLDLLLELLLIS